MRPIIKRPVMYSALSKYLFAWVIIVFVFCKTNIEPIKEKFISASDNLKISYDDIGHGDTTLFFIHGWCINKEYWQNQLDYFKNRYRCIAIDLPGFGASDKARQDWNFDQYSSDIVRCIESLKLKNVILIGHSMSGDIILKVASLKTPNVIGIVGIDNLHSPGQPYDSAQAISSKQFLDNFRANYDTVAINTMGNYLFQPSTTDNVKKRVLKNVLETDHNFSISVLEALAHIAQSERQMMSQLTMPLKLVNSDVQPVQLDTLNKYCAKGAKAFYVHGTGHYPMIEKADEFNLKLEEAIKSN